MTIDVHGHISPPEALRRYPMPPSLGDVTGMIESKLALGVRMTVVGSPVGAGAMVPIPGVDNYAQTDEALRRFHDWLGATVAAYPEHLRGLVYVNPFGGDRHLAAAADTYRAPQFVGFIANTSVGGAYLNDARAADFFALAAQLDAPVMLHAPASPAAAAGLTDLRLIEQLGRFGDVTFGVAACILGGWLDRYPRLRLLATGGGGALALLAEKLDLIAVMQHWRGPSDARPPTGHADAGRPASRSAVRPSVGQAQVVELARAPSAYLRDIWIDTATPSRAALRAGLDVFGSDRVMFGTDSPPLRDAVAPGLAAIADLPVPDQVKDDIRVNNAERFFRLDAAVPVAAPAARSFTFAEE